MSELIAVAAIVIGLVAVTWLIWPVLRRLTRWYWRSRLRYPLLLLIGAAALFFLAWSDRSQTSVPPATSARATAEAAAAKGALLSKWEVLELLRKALEPSEEACIDANIADLSGQIKGLDLLQAAFDLCHAQFGLGEAEASYRGSGIWFVTPRGSYRTQYLRDPNGKSFEQLYTGGPWLFDERTGRIVNQP